MCIKVGNCYISVLKPSNTVKIKLKRIKFMSNVSHKCTVQSLYAIICCFSNTFSSGCDCLHQVIVSTHALCLFTDRHRLLRYFFHTYSFQVWSILFYKI